MVKIMYTYNPLFKCYIIRFLGNTKTQQTVVFLHSKVKFYVNRNKNFSLNFILQCHTVHMTTDKSHISRQVIFPNDVSLIKHTHGVGSEAQIINRNIIEQMLCQTTYESILQRKVQCSLCALQRLNKSVHMDVAIR